MFQVIETFCHKLVVGNSTSTTCQCKSVCGGSAVYNNTYSSSAISTLRKLGNLVASGNITRYPLWMAEVLEDFRPFNSLCKCRVYGEWSSVDRIFFELVVYNFVDMLETLFFPTSPFTQPTSSIALIKVVNQVVDSSQKLKIIQYVINFLSPFFIIVSVFNLAITLRLNIKGSTAITFQIFQCVASLLIIFFSSFWIRNTVRALTNSGYAAAIYMSIFQMFSEVFECWNLFMGFCLMTDRSLCMLKPMFYRMRATRKKAMIISFSLFLISFALKLYCIAYIDYTQILPSYSAYYMVGLTGAGIIYSIIVFLQLILFAKLIIFFVAARNSQFSEQSNRNQTNINIILITAAAVECFATSSCAAYSINEGLYYYASYFHLSDLTILTANRKLLLQLVRDISIYIAPVLSFFICILLSKMYRQAFHSLFCCCCDKCQNIVKVLPMEHSNVKRKHMTLTSSI